MKFKRKDLCAGICVEKGVIYETVNVRESGFRQRPI